jgi:hypothetical protein
MTKPIEQDHITPELKTYGSIVMDYSPNYDVVLSNDVVIEGTRIKMNPNASTGSANLIDIDANDVEQVDALNDKYPSAWPSMYPGTTYTYWDNSTPNAPQTNAYKLVKAVQMYLYLNLHEIMNIGYNPENDNLEATNVQPSSINRRTYDDYYNETEFRLPPQTQYNRDILYDNEGHEVDVNGHPIKYAYLDEDMSPVFVSDQPGTAEELKVLKLGLQVAWKRGKLPDTIPPEWFTPEGELVTPIGEFTEEMLDTVRAVAIELFAPNYRTMPFSPHALTGLRKMASKLAGSNTQDLVSLDYMLLTEYQTTKQTPKTAYEWGGAYSTGRNTF